LVELRYHTGLITNAIRIECGMRLEFEQERLMSNFCKPNDSVINS